MIVALVIITISNIISLISNCFLIKQNKKYKKTLSSIIDASLKFIGSIEKVMQEMFETINEQDNDEEQQ